MTRTAKGWIIGLGILNVVLFITLVVLLVSRGPASSGTDEPPTDAVVEQTTDGGADPASEPVATSAPPSDEPTDEVLAPAPAGALELDAFALPSKNISCTLNADSLACTIANASFTPPAGDACEWRGQVVTLDGSGVAMPCPDGASVPAGDGTAILDYGQATAIGPWVCESSDRGVECFSRADGTGFTLARASFTSYGPGALR